MLYHGTYFSAVTFSLLCERPSRYCIQYKDGKLHDVLTFELIVVLSAFAAVFGYLRASSLYRQEQEEPNIDYELIGNVDGSFSTSSTNDEENDGNGGTTSQQDQVDRQGVSASPTPNDSN